jgi:predicted membrane-bound spermidine synthase
VFYDWQYLTMSASSTPPSVTVLAVFAGLLWPTFWMGISLPVLGHAVSRLPDEAAQRVGVLYGVNTLGAAAGAFISTWILVPRVGLDGAIRSAAGLNLLAVCAVITVMGRMRAQQPAPAAPAEVGARRTEPAATSGPRWGFSTWAILYGVAGFQALSLEILWFRLLGVMVKATAFTFGTLLTIYLAGLGLGAALGSAWLSRLRRPAIAFLALQAFVGLYAAASISGVTGQLEAGGLLASFGEYFARYEPLDPSVAFRNLIAGTSEGSTPSALFALYFVLPALLVGPPTLAMGASFTVLQKVVLVDLERMGRRVGIVLLANIAGAVAGSVMTGWIALTWLGSADSLRTLAFVGGFFLVLTAVASQPSPARSLRAVALAAAVLLTSIVVWSTPAGAQLWASLHGALPADVLQNEDATGVSVIKDQSVDRERFGLVFVNGIGQSRIPFGNIHTVLGALPAFIHASPRTAAVIGLGSGDTLYALAGRPDLNEVTSIEIIQPQLQTLIEWERRTRYPGLTRLLGDRRIRHIAGDGRIFLARSDRAFDLIEADALRPTAAYSGNLYSVGYFELMLSKLNPNGLAVTWAPTARVHDTFTSVFPHVLSFGDVVIGSPSPIHFDPEEVRQRIRSPGVIDHYASADVDIDALLAPYFGRTPAVIRRDQLTNVPVDLNEDLFPRDEFSLPRQQ